MNDFMIYGFGALFVCFTICTFFLTRIETGVVPEDYEFSLDPFWYISSMLCFAGPILYIIFPEKLDLIGNYNILDFLLPSLFSMIIYFSYLVGIKTLTNILIFTFALIISFNTAGEFTLFPEYLTSWQDKIIAAILIFIISKGLGLLNGIGAISSIQFLVVMLVFATLTYLGIMPQLLGVIALSYCGVMLGFLLLSWPPEKLIMNTEAFSAIGFVMACFMLNGAVEFNQTSMLISVVYIFVEIGISLYSKYICNVKLASNYMNTSYFQIADKSGNEIETIKGLIKIFVINFMLSIIQSRATEQLSLPIFAALLNLWLLSILSGKTKPIEVFSVTTLGKNTIKKIINKSKK